MPRQFLQRDPARSAVILNKIINQKIKKMETKELRILVIGAGGIGGITAAHMARAGYRVSVVDNMPSLAGRIEEKGLHVFGVNGDFTWKLKAHESLQEMTDRPDIVFIATKANALSAIVRDLKPVLKEDSVVVSLQNGICEEFLVNELGEGKVVGCVVGWGATVHSPGELEMTSTGDFVIGAFGKKPVNHFDKVVTLLETTAPVVTTTNVYGSLYSKLIINSCITTLGAICGLRLGKMLSLKKYRNMFIQIIREAVQVGRAAGIQIEKYAGKLDFYSFSENNDWVSALKKHLMIRIIGFKYRRLKSSSLQSLETGRKTEIDYLNGYIISKGRENKIDTPLNDYLVLLVKEIETGKRNISHTNFELSYFNQFS